MGALRSTHGLLVAGCALSLVLACGMVDPRMEPTSAHVESPLILGGELPLSAPAAGAAASRAVRLAGGPAGTFFATWSEEGYSMAVRIDASGALSGAQFAPFGGDATSTEVAFDSTTSQWLVLGTSNTKILGERYAATGVKVDASPFAIGSGSYSSLSYDGASFFVTSTSSTNSGIRATRISSQAVVGPSVTVTSDNPFIVDSACNDTKTCLVAWALTTGIFARLVDSTGALLGAGAITLSSFNALNPPRIAAASNGTDFVVTWSAPTQETLAARVSATTGLVDVKSLGATATQFPVDEALAFDGTNYIAAWRVNNTGIVGRRYAPDGTLPDAASSTIVADASADTPALARSGTQVLLGWQKSGLYPQAIIQVSRLTSALALVDAPVQLVKKSATQSLIAGAFNGTHHYIVWWEPSATGQLRGARFDANGAIVGAVTTLSTEGGVQSYYSQPAVATDGTDFLVVWRRTTNPGGGGYLIEVRGLRIAGATGAVLDAVPLSFTTTATARPDVAWDGQNYVVVWSDARDYNFTLEDIHARRLTAAGAMLDVEPFKVTQIAGYEYEPTIASDGKGALVTWEDHRFDDREGDIYGARIDQTGKVLDTNGFAISSAARSQAEPHVGFDGTNYVVAWNDERHGGRDGAIYASRVSTAGKTLDPSGILVTKGPAASPLVLGMRDGASTLIAWNEASAARGAFLRAPSAELLDPNGIDLVTPSGKPLGTGLFLSGPARATFVFSRFVPDDAARRGRLRFISSGGDTAAACTNAGECRARYCSDGVCCAADCSGPCKKCDGKGQCIALTGGDDPGACDGTRTCTAKGECLAKNGQSCTASNECASGFCVDGFCCDRACDGACESCRDTPGTCGPRPRGSVAKTSCAPLRCDGFTASCPTRCTGDEECEPGLGCDRPTGKCLEGPVCTDTATLRAPNGTITSCAPYACHPGACPTACKGVSDCAYPAVCDEAGRCVAPLAAPSVSIGCGIGSAPARTDLPFLVVAVVGFGLRRRRSR